MRVSLAIILSFFCSNLSYSEEREGLVLRGYVPPSIKTRIIQTQLSASRSLVTFSSQVNSRRLNEGQKFEVIGLDQAGFESKIKMVEGNDRTIQYELMIKKIKDVTPSDKPVFLKISAN